MKCKKTIDARSYSHEALEKLRRDSIVRMDNGESPEDVAIGLGFNRRTIYRWLSAYHYGGVNALAAKPLSGAPPKFDGKNLAKLLKMLRERTPQQFKFQSALWTLLIIREVIKQKFEINLSEASVGRLMKRLGFSPQRPLYRAWQQDPVRVQQWQDKVYPEIAKRAKREGAWVMFADEVGIHSDFHAGATWSPMGQTPVVRATGARYGLNMISAVSAQGQFRFMVVDGRVNATVFCGFLQKLITGMDRKIFLVVDGHPARKAKLIQRFVGKNSERIELFYLPPYAPELNPDELVWNHVKTRVGKGVVQTKETLESRGKYAPSLTKTP